MGENVVLYVEDEDAAYMLFAAVVEDAHLPVRLHRAADGEEALAMLRGGSNDGHGGLHPDLVILDLNLPRKDGLEVLSEIKSDEKLRRLPVVVFTSSVSDSDQRRSRDLGARAYVNKPFSYDRFLEAVNTVCSYLPAA